MSVHIPAIQNELRQLGSREIAVHSLRFFKTGRGQYGEGDIFLGIRVPVLRRLAEKYDGIKIDQALLLLRSEYHEERLLALFLLVNRFKKTSKQEKKAIFDLYLKNTRYINNWDLVDCSAEHIVGAFLRERDRGVLYDLARAASLWERRIAIMATFHFIKRNEFVDTMNIAEILLADRQDLIHKAAGWMLREVGKRDLSVEEDFLKKHYQKMPRTMLRYAIEKFPETIRKNYLHGRI